MSWKVLQVALESSAVLAAVLAGLWVLVNNRTHLYATYRLDQKKELKILIGKYHGRMLEAAVDWDRRMRQLYDEQWKYMCPGEKRYEHEQYLYHSVIFRFLSLLSIARKFEAEAFFIDSQIASGRQIDFLRYAKSFLWVATHSDLTEDDDMPGRDHFRSDEFRPLLDACYRRVPGVLPEDKPTADEVVFDWRRYRAMIDQAQAGQADQARTGQSMNGQSPKLDFDTLDLDTRNVILQVLNFFEGIRPEEYTRKHEKDEATGEVRETETLVKRRRWDRIVCMHVLVLCFIGTFGYPWQKKRREIRPARRGAIKMLQNEASNAKEIPSSAETKWRHTLIAFEDSLKMIGLDTNKFNQIFVYLPRMAGRRQIRELRHELKSAINDLPADGKVPAVDPMTVATPTS
jgi:hypothetical protein